MAMPVWVLSVDLTTKTASFQTGMSDAAKAARGSFQDIKDGAADMSRATGGSMAESRHGVMLLGEEFGVRLPRALTSFIASIGPVGAAMQAAFPFLAIIVGATLLLEHLSKLKEAGEKLTLSQQNFGTTVANVLNGLNDKLLQAGIRADELSGNHLAALNKQLELIDHQSMNELVRSFNEVAKASDETFAQLKTSWYQLGAGSAGAKNSMDQFKASYDAMLADHDDKGAMDLLNAKVAREERILALQKQIQDSSKPGATQSGDGGLSLRRAYNELQAMGVGYTEKEVASQQILVQGLEAQLKNAKAINDTNALDKSNTKQTDLNKDAGDADKVARINAESQRKADEDAEKDREKAYRTAVENLQESERAKIEATNKGSAARLAAIDAAIKEEESKGLQETGFYKALCNSKIETTRQMNEEQKKLDAEAGKESAEHEQKMSELQLQAFRQNDQLLMSARHTSISERVAVESAAADEDYQIKMAAAEKELAALDKTANDYQNKVKALQNKEEELEKEHQNRLAQIKDKSQEQQNAVELAAQQRWADDMSKELANVLGRHERFGQAMVQIGDQMAIGMIENAIKAILANDMTKPSDAGAAARKAFKAGEDSIPGIPGVILGGVMAAATFAEVMAFADGGIVPGVGRGDIVPARLEPGEGVLSNKVMDGLRAVAAGNGSGGGDSHYHYSPTIHLQSLDSEGMDRVLTKHADVVKKHFISHARRLNQ
jgi:hypothetical protein